MQKPVAQSSFAMAQLPDPGCNAAMTACDKGLAWPQALLVFGMAQRRDAISFMANWRTSHFAWLAAAIQITTQFCTFALDHACQALAPPRLHHQQCAANNATPNSWYELACLAHREATLELLSLPGCLECNICKHTRLTKIDRTIIIFLTASEYLNIGHPKIVGALLVRRPPKGVRNQKGTRDNLDFAQITPPTVTVLVQCITPWQKNDPRCPNINFVFCFFCFL